MKISNTVFLCTSIKPEQQNVYREPLNLQTPIKTALCSAPGPQFKSGAFT